MGEKRGFDRRDLRALVRFEGVVEGEEFSIYSRAMNVSDGGVFLATHYLLDPGTELLLHIQDPSGLESVREAKVVRIAARADDADPFHTGIGVQFVV